MTIQETYSLIIEAEISSQKLYKALAKSFSNPETSDLFKELVLLEENHETRIRAAFSTEFPGEELPTMENPPWEMKAIKLDDPADVLAYAISREELAQSTYISLAHQTETPEIQALLLQFAEEETQHKNLLLAETQRLHGAMQWFDPSELNGLMED